MDIDQAMIVCTHCNRELPRSNFLPSHKPGGWCRACHNSTRRDKRSGLIPERDHDVCLNCGKDITHLRRHAKYCDPACASMLWRKEHPGYARNANLKTTYNLTSVQVQAQLIAQGSICAICETPEPGGNGWHVDHCHKTDNFRGVLCGPCNQGLGNFKDNVQSLINAIKYLAKFDDM